MDPVWVAIIGIVYLLLLFKIASKGEQKARRLNNYSSHPLIYTLSLGVYCTAWTYYGSIERAAFSGIDFVAIYLGPTIMAILFYPVLRKIIRISNVLHLTSLADFISVRYGKSFNLGLIVTLFCVIGVIPYMALQIKAIVLSFEAVSGQGYTLDLSGSMIWVAIGATAVLSVFTILYGAKHLDPLEKHKGLVNVIAFESFIKLIAFFIIGVFVTYVLFDGFGDIFSQVAAHPEYRKLLTLNTKVSYPGWSAMVISSFFAMLFLPRQFHMGVVENVESNHLKIASWLFPLYLLLINIFVLPIAFGGLLAFGGNGIAAGNFTLAFAGEKGNAILSIITWIGGLSAASGMIIVESIALSIMLSNNLVIPLYFKYSNLNKRNHSGLSSKILLIRRIGIVFVLLLALLYFLYIGKNVSLVDIGLVSFCAVSQFAPSVFGGLFWKQGSRNAAFFGILSGALLWFYTLIVPSLANGSLIGSDVLEEGLFGISMLKPTQLLGISQMDKYAHSLFWSLGINTLLYIFISIYTKRNSQEIYHSELFVEIFKHSSSLEENRIIWKGTAYQKDLQQLLGNFLGEERARNLLVSYAVRNKFHYDLHSQANPRMVTFTERILSGVVGTTSARILMSNTTKEEEISMQEVVHILRENQQMMNLNKELRRKSSELSRATGMLQQANDRLLEMDELKDEFLYTVTHEIRTPLTSIKALSEILRDNDDLPKALRMTYLESIVSETSRLAHLISSVLRLEKFESGKQRLNVQQADLRTMVKDIIDTYLPVLKEKGIELILHIDSSMMIVSCDKDMIQQVLVNLIDNASKFASTQVSVKAFRNVDEWQVWVSDDGPGVEAESKEKIFDKFFQAKNQTLKKPGGSGLGLAICSKIIELHNGKIWIEDRKPKGACFIFSLPDHI